MEPKYLDGLEFRQETLSSIKSVLASHRVIGIETIQPIADLCLLQVEQAIKEIHEQKSIQTLFSFQKLEQTVRSCAEHVNISANLESEVLSDGFKQLQHCSRCEQLLASKIKMSVQQTGQVLEKLKQCHSFLLQLETSTGVDNKLSICQIIVNEILILSKLLHEKYWMSLQAAFKNYLKFIEMEQDVKHDMNVQKLIYDIKKNIIRQKQLSEKLDMRGFRKKANDVFNCYRKCKIIEEQIKTSRLLTLKTKLTNQLTRLIEYSAKVEKELFHFKRIVDLEPLCHMLENTLLDSLSSLTWTSNKLKDAITCRYHIDTRKELDIRKDLFLELKGQLDIEECYSKYLENQSAIWNSLRSASFLYMDSILFSSKLSIFIETLKTENIDVLLISITTPIEITQSEALQLLLLSSTKKLVFVGSDLPKNQMVDMVTYKCKDIEFADLSDDSQEFVLNTSVNFQGTSIQLKYLIPNKSDILHCIKGDLIQDLMKSAYDMEEINVGLNIDLPFNFVPCRLTRNTVVKGEFFGVCTASITAISGIGPDLFQNLLKDGQFLTTVGAVQTVGFPVKGRLFVLLKTAEEASEFQKLCSLTDRAIHWLEHTDGCWRWRASNKRLQEVQKYVQSESAEEVIVNSGNDISATTVIIEGEHGMGKTTLLRYVAQVYKQTYSDMWIVLLDFTECIFQLVDTFTDSLLENYFTLNNNKLEKFLFNYSVYTLGNVGIFLDTCVVNPNSIVSYLEKLIRVKCKCLWVTCRNSSIFFDCNPLKVIPYKLNGYALNELKNIMLSFWNSSKYDPQNVNDMITVATDLLKQTDIETFNPSHVFVFLEEFENCIEDGITGSKSPTLHDVYERMENDLRYGSFCKSGISNLCDEKNPIKYGRTKVANCMLHLGVDLIDQRIMNFASGCTKEKPCSILTFGDYLIAAWMYRELHSCAKHLKAVISIPEGETAAYFFNTLVAKSCKLHLAVLHGNFSAVTTLIASGEDVNGVDECGRTPLHLVSFSKHFSCEILKLLLEEGASDEATDTLLDWKPIQYADARFAFCQNDGWQMIEMLMSKQPGSNSISIVDLVTSGLVHTVKHCLDEEDACKPLDEDGNTLIHIATLEGNADTVQALLECGVPLYIKNQKGNTAAHVAAVEGQLGVLQALLNNGVALNTRNDDGETLLFLAASEGQLEVVKLLLNSGAIITETDNEGFSPVLAAALNGQTEVVDALLEYGANINNGTAEHLPPLHQAASEGHYKTVEFLLDKGADVNNGEHGTALHTACQGNHTDTVQLLIDRGADVNKADSLGWTPLHVACEQGFLDVAKMLVDAGAHLQTKNDDHQSPRDLAADNLHYNIVLLLDSCLNDSVVVVK